nr:MAG TPA: hypothetical protein [Caudoviricetes sp.]
MIKYVIKSYSWFQEHLIYVFSKLYNCPHQWVV